jgi:hydroxyacylglutathione hydrolase
MLKQTKIDNEIIFFTAEHSNVNAVLIENVDFLICIDSLQIPSDSKALSSYINSLAKPLKYLINTHGHSDHISGNRFLKQPSTYIISQERYALTNWSEKAFLKNVSPRINPNRLLQPDIVFSQNLNIPECNLQIIHTPGHTPDASVVYLPDKKILITGDTILNSDSNQIAVPFFYYGDLDIMISSLKRLLILNIDTILPGHGIPCPANKIGKDILYLENFKRLMDDFLEKNSYLTVIQLKEMAFIQIGAEDCIPGTNKKDFWVPKMHQLNIERYIEWKMDGSSVYTLNFPKANNQILTREDI